MPITEEFLKLLMEQNATLLKQNVALSKQNTAMAEQISQSVTSDPDHVEKHMHSNCSLCPHHDFCL